MAKRENVISAKHSVLKSSVCRKTNILVKVQSKERMINRRIADWFTLGWRTWVRQGEPHWLTSTEVRCSVLVTQEQVVTASVNFLSNIFFKGLFLSFSLPFVFYFLLIFPVSFFFFFLISISFWLGLCFSGDRNVEKRWMDEEAEI